jgi:hypothetical protein
MGYMKVEGNPGRYKAVVRSWAQEAQHAPPYRPVYAAFGGVNNRQLRPIEKAVLAMRLVERKALADIAESLSIEPHAVSGLIKKACAVIHFHDRKQLRDTGTRRYKAPLTSTAIPREHIIQLIEQHN